MDKNLTLGLQRVQEVLMISNGVDATENAVKAFRSRLGHLQRSGFPASAKVGRFARASYGLEDLLQLSVVFALVQSYVPPVLGRKIVADFWPEIARLFLAALKEQGFSALGYIPNDAPLIMTVAPRALSDLGSEARVHGKGGVDQGYNEVSLHRSWDRGAERTAPNVSDAKWFGPTTISVDFQVLAARLAGALGEARMPELAASATELASRLGWTK